MTVNVTPNALDVLKLQARGIIPGAITWDVHRQLLREGLVSDGPAGLHASDRGKQVVEDARAKDALHLNLVDVKPCSNSGPE